VKKNPRYRDFRPKKKIPVPEIFIKKKKNPGHGGGVKNLPCGLPNLERKVWSRLTHVPAKLFYRISKIDDPSTP